MLQFPQRKFRQHKLLILLLIAFLTISGVMLSRATTFMQPVTNSASIPVNASLPTEAMALQAANYREPILPIPLAIALDLRKVELGNRLFHDPQLSRTGKMSCASCHDLQRAGIDQLPKSIGNDGNEIDRNAPTVFNSGFNFKQFWDGRAETLEAQIEATIQNSREMATSWPEIIAKLKQDREYVRAFATIYGKDYGKDGIQPNTIKNAIATFEQSLITPNSRFDQFLRGKVDAITAEEKKGYDRFKSYGCIACHQGMNVGGNLFQTLGVMKPYYTPSEATQSDQGRFNLTQNYVDRHVFKVPSLRNVELTAPYFHDGHVKTLEEAVKIMAEYQLGRNIPDKDIILILNFLQTLTGQFTQEQS